MNDEDPRLTALAAAAVEAPHIAALARLAGPDVGPQLAQVLTELMRQTRRANAGVTRTDRHETALWLLRDATAKAYEAMLE